MSQCSGIVKDPVDKRVSRDAEDTDDGGGVGVPVTHLGDTCKSTDGTC